MLNRRRFLAFLGFAPALPVAVAALQAGDLVPAGYGTFWLQVHHEEPILWRRFTLGLGQYRIEYIELGSATLWRGPG